MDADLAAKFARRRNGGGAVATLALLAVHLPAHEGRAAERAACFREIVDETSKCLCDADARVVRGGEGTRALQRETGRTRKKDPQTWEISRASLELLLLRSSATSTAASPAATAPTSVETNHWFRPDRHTSKLVSLAHNEVFSARSLRPSARLCFQALRK